MTTTTDTAPAELIPAGTILSDPAACMAELARMAAIREVASRRSEVASERLRALSGMAAGWRASTDAGDPLVTDPKDAPHVTDLEAWHRYVLEHHGDRARLVTRVLHGKLDAIVADQSHPAHDLLLELLGELEAVATETVVDDKLLPDLHKRGAVVTVDGDDGETWQALVDPDGQQVPGVEVRAKSAPQLRATVDRKYLERLTGDLLDRVGLPEVPGGDE